MVNQYLAQRLHDGLGSNPIIEGALAKLPKDILITKYLDNKVQDIINIPYGTLPPDIFPEENMEKRYLTGFDNAIKNELSDNPAKK